VRWSGQVQDDTAFLLDVVGRHTIAICGKEYDCACVMMVTMTELSLLDRNGSGIYVHWYDCITDYIL